MCVCLDYTRTNEQIFIKKFSEVPFQCIFNDFGFLLDISMKNNLNVLFYFIVFLTILEGLVTWSEAFCSL